MFVRDTVPFGIPAVTIPEGSLGDWSVQRFEVKEDSPGRINFNRPSRSVDPGIYTRLMHRKRGVIMSDTVAERRDHSHFVSRAQGHVLINGLGIGMCLAAVLRKPSVTKATVVEVDADVIALVGPHYAYDSRVEIVNASAFDYKPPKGVRYGAVWHDIWDEITSENLPEMTRLHRKYGRRTDWQGSWARYDCECLR